MDEKKYLNEFKKKYTYQDIKDYIDRIKDLSIAIAGETIIDEYVYGKTLGKAGKFPIVAFQNESIERYEGGIRAIYNHLKSYSDKVSIATRSPAIVKRRYVQNGQKLFETYYHESIEPSLVNDLNKFNLIVMSDFGHDYFNKATINNIYSKDIFKCLNTQFNAGNEGLNTINKYNKDADYICIDAHELRLAFSNIEDSLERILDYWKDKNAVVSITDSFKGCIVYHKGNICKIPAFAKDVVDSTGAGDTFLAITSPLVYMDAPIEVVGFIGNCAGAIACSYQGNKEDVDKERLLLFIKSLYED